MMRTTQINCDHCEALLELDVEDNVLELGWIEVAKYDMMSEEVRHYDFCSTECLAIHFG